MNVSRCQNRTVSSHSSIQACSEKIEFQDKNISEIDIEQKGTQYDYIKSNARCIFTRFIKTPHINDFISLNLLPRHDTLKEISEIFGLWSAIQRFIPTEPEEQIVALDVGAGYSPRLGAWVALNTPWQVLAIDPELRKPIAQLPANLRMFQGCVEDCDLSKYYDVPNRHIIVMMVHAHVSLDKMSLVLQGCQKASVVTMPCCNYLGQQAHFNGLPCNVEYMDRDILSRHNMLRVWEPRKMLESKDTQSTSNDAQSKKTNFSCPNVNLMVKRKATNHYSQTANKYTEYHKTLSHIDRFISGWEIHLFECSKSRIDDMQFYPKSWLFNKKSMAHGISRASYLEHFCREMLEKFSTVAGVQKNTIPLIVIEQGRHPRYAGWLACSMVNPVIVINKVKPKKPISPKWYSLPNLTITTGSERISHSPYLIVATENCYTPDAAIKAFGNASFLAMLFNSDRCFDFMKTAPDESRLVWNVLSPLRRFRIWHPFRLAS